MLLWFKTMSADDDDDDYERIVAMLDSVSIAGSYELLCLNYRAPLCKTSIASLGTSPSMLSLAQLNVCLLGSARTLLQYWEVIWFAYNTGCRPRNIVCEE
jgi:hypothetical protein